MVKLEAFLRERIRYGLILGAVLWSAWLFSIALGGGVFDYFGKLSVTDHIAFYSAARMIRDGEAAEIYNNEKIAIKQLSLVGDKFQGEYEAYRNPPFYALLYVPTAYWPYPVSAWFWAGLSFLAIMIGTWLLQPKFYWHSLAWVFCFYPTFCAISYGQNTPLSFLIFCVVYRLLNAQQLFLAGCVASLLCFKPTLITGLALWGLFQWRRYWPCAVGVIVTASFLCGLSYWLLPESWAGFVHTLRDNASFDQMDWWKNLTPRSFFRVLIGNDRYAWPFTLFVTFIGIYYLWKVTQWLPPRLSFALVVPLTLWFSPHSLIYEWLLLIIPALIIAHETQGKIDWTMLFLGAFLLALIGPLLTQFQLRFMTHAVHVVVLIYGWMILFVIKKLVNLAPRLEATASPLHN